MKRPMPRLRWSFLTTAPSHRRRLLPAEELLEFCKKYPGKVTYPALPDFTGSAFVRNIIYELCGWEQFQDRMADY